MYQMSLHHNHIYCSWLQYWHLMTLPNTEEGNNHCAFITYDYHYDVIFLQLLHYDLVTYYDLVYITSDTGLLPDGVNVDVMSLRY